MSELIEIKVPDLGGSTEVDVIEVLVKPGDVVAQEQTLAVMESDKATMDMPTTVAGTVQDVKVKVGDKISQGVVIAVISAAAAKAQTTAEPEPAAAADSEPAATAPEPEAAPPAQATPAQAPEPAPTKPLASAPAKADEPKPHATPAVRLFARELGVDLNNISYGSGRKGRILKQDVTAFVKQTLNTRVQPGSLSIAPIPEIDFSQFGEIEQQPLSKIKKLTGQNLTRVWLNLPMVTHHDEADITELEAFRGQINTEGKNGKITGLIFIIKALAAAMKLFPQFNASLSSDGENLILKKYCHIGIAVDTPNGLVVPVLRDVDQKNIQQLSSELADLSEKARNGKLQPKDMQGGCMTISSLGGIGGTAFTPIVNAPEVAILGITRSKLQPVWDGSQFQPRLMLPLDLSYDHRVIDGAEAARFMVTLAQFLSDFRRVLL
ncbi:MAG: dihydrolipoyllysine-residue acetyltransferase [Gammaproteobacteria bacterium HGW-Gammaproteobacteria-3]|nr:MAG: dihydrolipoyllysine-residue acetyltransferase [Gammaproteobacteria bacterium HGW-Gammaproteobacteria-3]